MEIFGIEFLRSLFQIISIPQAIYYYPGITLIAIFYANIKEIKIEDSKNPPTHTMDKSKGEI